MKETENQTITIIPALSTKKLKDYCLKHYSGNNLATPFFNFTTSAEEIDAIINKMKKEPNPMWMENGEIKADWISREIVKILLVLQRYFYKDLDDFDLNKNFIDGVNEIIPSLLRREYYLKFTSDKEIKKIGLRNWCVNNYCGNGGLVYSSKPFTTSIEEIEAIVDKLKDYNNSFFEDGGIKLFVKSKEIVKEIIFYSRLFIYDLRDIEINDEFLKTKIAYLAIYRLSQEINQS